MSKLIQIRNVPDPIHRVLKSRAAEAGMTLSDFLLREISAVAARPTVEELLTALSERGPIDERFDTAAAVRSERDARG